MTTHRVSILCLDQSQVDAARAILIGAPEVNGDYLMGLVGDKGLTQLDDGGLLYNVEPPPAEQAAAATAQAADGLRALEDGDGGDDEAAASHRVVIDLVESMGPQVAHMLAEAGATLGERTGHSTYIAAFTGDIEALRAIPQVREASWYGRAATLPAHGLVAAARKAVPALARRLHAETSRSPAARLLDLGGALSAEFSLAGDDDSFGSLDFGEETSAALPIGGEEETLVGYDVRCHSKDEVAGCAASIEGIEGVRDLATEGARIRYWVPAPLADEVQRHVAGLQQTAVVEPYIKPEILVEFSRRALWGAATAATVGGWTGDGEIVALADTGIDDQHPDFDTRIDLIGPTAPPPDRDPQGHGTHVASIIAGSGTASGGQLAGVAPKARLAVQRLGEGLAAMPLDVSALYESAFASGARVYNLSWGSQVNGHYVLNSDDLDAFVERHPEMLVVVAAGNWGAQDLIEEGFPIANASLGAPSNAKNCLSVGACCSPRTDGPYATLLWSQYDGRFAPSKPPMATLPLTGDDSIVAASSSRGPTDDNRIKPDLVAVGIGVAAARSHDRGEPIKPWGNGDLYMYLSGTSMAAPAVSGAAALVREYLRKQRDHQPRAALLKAILINAAQWLPGTQQEDPAIGNPNQHQGFGRLDISRAIPHDENGPFRLNIVDLGDGDDGAPQMQKVTAPPVNWRGSFAVVDAGAPLSITLCWTDPPGRWLQHDLDLVVIDPAGKSIAGNNLLARMPGQKMDRLNNVERVIVEAPQAGEWTIMVKPFNTFLHPQGFGLAATGNISDWIV